MAQNTNLADEGFHRGLDACILLNPGTAKVSPKTMATTMEAILGAVDLDAGPDAMTKVANLLGIIHPILVPKTLSSPVP